MEIIRPENKQPMPAHAKLVFKGVLHDVYQWEQQGFDGSTMVFEKLARPDTVNVIAVTEDKRILIAHQEQPGKPPFRSLPGGRVDEGEDILAAAKRELLEESGYESSEWELLSAYQPLSKIDWAIFSFVARGAKKVADQTLDAGEKIEIEPVDFDMFLGIVLQPDFLEQELRIQILEAKLDPAKMQELRHKILGY